MFFKLVPFEKLKRLFPLQVGGLQQYCLKSTIQNTSGLSRPFFLFFIYNSRIYIISSKISKSSNVLICPFTNYCPPNPFLLKSPRFENPALNYFKTNSKKLKTFILKKTFFIFNSI